MRKIIFRADGSASIGLGHVIRSLALIEMLKEKFHCLFAIQAPAEALIDSISEVSADIIVLSKPDSKEGLLRELDPYLDGNEIVVLDGYKFDTEYQLRIKGKGCQLVCIDDIHSYHFIADIIINHGITDSSVYSHEPYTRMLVGPKYSLLRQAFMDQASYDFIPKKEKRIFVCFGGADIFNLTYTYTKKLVQQQNISAVDIVVGSAFKHSEELEDLIRDNQTLIHVHRNIGPNELVDVIRKCSVAIVPGSTIAIECASLGIPMMCGFYVDNQRDIVQMLGETKLALVVGDFLSLEDFAFTECLKKLLSADGASWFERRKNFFDGKVRKRFIESFDQLSLIRRLDIRLAMEADVDLYHRWANDAGVRQSAINQREIPFNSHSSWFTGKLNSSDTFLYIGEMEGKEIGQVRFDKQDDAFYIDYSISAEYRGKGLGSQLLLMAINKLVKEQSVDFNFKGLVLTSNKASAAVFSKLGFKEEGVEMKDDKIVIVFSKFITHKS